MSRRFRPDTYLFFLALFALVLFLTHLPFLTLPYFWDELGQFVPAALDLFQSGAWIPHSAQPNVHPPGVMAWLAAFWSITGYSITSTRVAMLLVASAAVLAAFLLAIELCGGLRGAPAFAAVVLLCASPLFYAQAMLAQLDMPAMLFTSLALLLFLQDRLRAAAAVCGVLVLVKETGLIVPLLFVGWLCAERKFRQAAYFVLPALLLAGWLALLARSTGHLFGNTEFTRYNLYYPLHPVRFLAALGRRLYYLFVADFHWIGTLAIAMAWRRTSIFQTRAWRVAGALLAAHILLLSTVGGAALERYLLPVLPILYAAMMAATSTVQGLRKLFAQAALAAGLLAGIFWNPPYPFPFENNLAFTDFVRLQQTAADFVSLRYPDRRIATAWPLSSALRRSELGYVRQELDVRETPDFRVSTLQALDWSGVDVLVIFSRMWEPEWSFTRIAPVRRLWQRFYCYEPDATSPPGAGFQQVGHWSRRGLWIDVYTTHFLIKGASPAPPY